MKKKFSTDEFIAFHLRRLDAKIDRLTALADGRRDANGMFAKTGLITSSLLRKAYGTPRVGSNPGRDLLKQAVVRAIRGDK